MPPRDEKITCNNVIQGLQVSTQFIMSIAITQTSWMYTVIINIIYCLFAVLHWQPTTQTNTPQRLTSSKLYYPTTEPLFTTETQTSFATFLVIRSLWSHWDNQSWVIVESGSITNKWLGLLRSMIKSPSWQSRTLAIWYHRLPLDQRCKWSQTS